jgi:hypothetical protein
LSLAAAIAKSIFICKQFSVQTYIDKSNGYLRVSTTPLAMSYLVEEIYISTTPQRVEKHITENYPGWVT